MSPGSTKYIYLRALKKVGQGEPYNVLFATPPVINPDKILFPALSPRTFSPKYDTGIPATNSVDRYQWQRSYQILPDIVFIVPLEDLVKSKHGHCLPWTPEFKRYILSSDGFCQGNTSVDLHYDLTGEIRIDRNIPRLHRARENRRIKESERNKRSEIRERSNEI